MFLTDAKVERLAFDWHRTLNEISFYAYQFLLTQSIKFQGSELFIQRDLEYCTPGSHLLGFILCPGQRLCQCYFL